MDKKSNGKGASPAAAILMVLMAFIVILSVISWLIAG